MCGECVCLCCGECVWCVCVCVCVSGTSIGELHVVMNM